MVAVSGVEVATTKKLDAVLSVLVMAAVEHFVEIVRLLLMRMQIAGFTEGVSGFEEMMMLVDR